MGFDWSPSDCNSRQFSRTLLSILADLSNAVVWMISVLPLISDLSRHLTKLAQLAGAVEYTDCTSAGG